MLQIDIVIDGMSQLTLLEKSRIMLFDFLKHRGKKKFSILDLGQFLEVEPFLGWDETFFDIHS